MHNLTSFLTYHARLTPDSTALVYQDQYITYADLKDRVLNLAGWLKDRGVCPDDIVALVMKNSAAFVEISFAVSHLGAVLLPINYRLAASEVDYILDHAGAKLVFVDKELTDLASKLGDIVVIDEAS